MGDTHTAGASTDSLTLTTGLTFISLLQTEELTTKGYEKSQIKSIKVITKQGYNLQSCAYSQSTVSQLGTAMSAHIS